MAKILNPKLEFKQIGEESQNHDKIKRKYQ